MADAKTGGTVELTEGFYVKAADVQAINVTKKGGQHGGFCARVIHNGNGWESDEMDNESANKLVSEINKRVNDALGTTPTVITKTAAPAAK